jgi:hypothetical protein
MLTRTAPRRDGLIEVIGRLLMSRDPEVPPGDTFDRSDYRMGIVLACYDRVDDPINDPGMAVRDLLTDVLHYCEARNITFENEVAGAIDMFEQEQAEWDAREAAEDAD